MTRDVATHVLITSRAPAHTESEPSRIAKGTVVVAHDQVAGAAAFVAHPEAYDELERVLVSPQRRNQPDYYAYSLSFAVRDIGDLLEPLLPASPRPENRLPRR